MPHSVLFIGESERQCFSLQLGDDLGSEEGTSNTGLAPWQDIGGGAITALVGRKQAREHLHELRIRTLPAVEV